MYNKSSWGVSSVRLLGVIGSVLVVVAVFATVLYFVIRNQQINEAQIFGDSVVSEIESGDLEASFAKLSEELVAIDSNAYLNWVFWVRPFSDQDAIINVPAEAAEHSDASLFSVLSGNGEVSLTYSTTADFPVRLTVKNGEQGWRVVDYAATN